MKCYVIPLPAEIWNRSEFISAIEDAINAGRQISKEFNLGQERRRFSIACDHIERIAIANAVDKKIEVEGEAARNLIEALKITEKITHPFVAPDKVSDFLDRLKGKLPKLSRKEISNGIVVVTVPYQKSSYSFRVPKTQSIAIRHIPKGLLPDFDETKEYISEKKKHRVKETHRQIKEALILGQSFNASAALVSHETFIKAIRDYIYVEKEEKVPPPTVEPIPEADTKLIELFYIRLANAARRYNILQIEAVAFNVVTLGLGLAVTALFTYKFLGGPWWPYIFSLIPFLAFTGISLLRLSSKRASAYYISSLIDTKLNLKTRLIADSIIAVGPRKASLSSIDLTGVCQKLSDKNIKRALPHKLPKTAWGTIALSIILPLIIFLLPDFGRQPHVYNDVAAPVMPVDEIQTEGSPEERLGAEPQEEALVSEPKKEEPYPEEKIAKAPKEAKKQLVPKVVPQPPLAESQPTPPRESQHLKSLPPSPPLTENVVSLTGLEAKGIDTGIILFPGERARVEYIHGQIKGIKTNISADPKYKYDGSTGIRDNVLVILGNLQGTGYDTVYPFLRGHRAIEFKNDFPEPRRVTLYYNGGLAFQTEGETNWQTDRRKITFKVIKLTNR